MTAIDPLAPSTAASPEQREACDGPDPLDPETPEAAIEEQARALGLDPDALRRRGEEIGRSLRSAAEELTAERLDELDRRAREAAERAAKATAGPWDPTCHRVVQTTLPIGDGEDVSDVCEILHYGNDGGVFPAGTATFIAAAREDVPALAAAVLALSAEIRRLREREARLVHERECLGTAIADAALKAGIYSGKPVTGPELFLLCQEMADAIRLGQERAERLEAEQCRRQLLGEMAVADVVDGLLEEEEA